MNHISEVIEDILVEWAHRVHDGMPNPKNELHIIELRKSLEELNFPNDVIYKLIENIINEEGLSSRERERAKKMNLVHLGKGAYGKEGGEPTHQAVDGKLVAKDGEEESEKETKPPMKIDANPMDKEKKEKDIDTTSTEENRTKDHQDTDAALNYSKTQEQKDKETGTSDFDKGAGTHVSRAGEASTHKALRMLKDGSSYDDVREQLMYIANDKDTFLTKEWVNASIAATKSIESTFGIDNVDEIVWDTKSGHKTIDVENHGTSADMFVKLKDGTRVGVSLKKDGKVFIRNGGHKQVFNKLSEDLLSRGVSEAEVEEFKKNAGIESFQEDLKQSINSGVDKLKISNAYSEIVDELKTDTEYARKVLGPNYEKYINRMDDELFDRLQGKSGKMTKDDVKIIAKISATEKIMSEDSSIYNDMRNADIRLTQRFLQGIQNSNQIESAIKDEVLKGIHVEQIFGTDDEINLDKFMTVYGIEPDGSQLSERTLLNLFGSDVENTLKDYRDVKSDENKKILQKSLRNRLSIDYKDGAKDGTIKIQLDDGSELPLFTIKSRSRGIGASPTFEMAQTNFMSNALKFGTNVNEWPEPQKSNFLKKQSEEE
tara:strand:- start:3147 stop:4949 length:1803 start_codon:yes stop_codon:yes gene_type:complete